MDLESTKVGSSLIMTVRGRMDAVTAPAFQAESNTWIENDEKTVVVDLSGVEYISSAGLRSLLFAAKALKANQGEIRFCNLTGMVQEVFSISGFSSMFTIYETLEEALA